MSEELTNPFESYKPYLKPQDIMDATQYGQTFVYELIRRIEVQKPGSVIRGRRKGTRVHRDTFFKWFIEHMQKG